MTSERVGCGWKPWSRVSREEGWTIWATNERWQASDGDNEGC